MRVNVNERDEITASVAAHSELGSRYDSAVAEGLVERIGEEIDKRIDARLGGQQTSGNRAPAAPPRRPAPATYQPPYVPTPSGPAAVPPPARRNSGLSGMVLGLGSMGLGVGATSVVVSHGVGGATEIILVLLIWAAIVIINVAHSQRN